MDIRKIKAPQLRVAVLIPTVPGNEKEFDFCIRSLFGTMLPKTVKMDVWKLLNDYEGFAVTINKGIEQCRDYDYIAILNDDIILTNPMWLVNMLQEFDKNYKIGANVGIVTESSGFRGTHVVFYCTLIRSDVFNIVGNLDERFHPAYVEDIDFSVRCRDKGILFSALDYDVCKHLVQHTVGKNPNKEEMITKNWERFAEKWKGTRWEDFKQKEDARYKMMRGQ